MSNMLRHDQANRGQLRHWFNGKHAEGVIENTRKKTANDTDKVDSDTTTEGKSGTTTTTVRANARRWMTHSQSFGHLSRLDSNEFEEGAKDRTPRAERARSEGSTRHRQFAVAGRIHLGEGEVADHLDDEASRATPTHHFSTSKHFVYVPFRDDFGPMDLSSVVRFCRLMTKKLVDFPREKIVLCGGRTKRDMTNAAFLLGCYLILEEAWKPKAVWAPLSTLDVFEPYIDISGQASEFKLYLIDCWRAVEKAAQMGWISQMGGTEIDIEEYEHYADPANGDLHQLVPGKLIAFRGPVDVEGTWKDVKDQRLFHPDYYVDIFRDCKVSTVVRLNEAAYDAAHFEAAGFEHHSLPFPDGSAPPRALVDKFLAIVDAAPGAVAVHCQAGLGRTGTMIALWMMRNLAFSAREAIAWARIARPGSVSGEQQQFVKHVELLWAHTPRPRAASEVAGRNSSAMHVTALFASDSKRHRRPSPTTIA